ncbi:hypothetical protein [Nocardioides sediminis]|uniref:hypothetical protein n=1 Tax=Nocardioides sediminis TaxID=433648 RepID=UPI00131F00AC|nr:hypothetical protein [Nocardioides sediminis]
MSKEKPVKWPGKAYDPDGPDLGGPLQQLLLDLHVIEKEGDEDHLGPLKGTPYSIQVITAGATSLGKAWSALIALLGGGGAIAAGLRGLGYANDDPLMASVFTGSAAVLLAAVSISIAVMVKADVTARAEASAAQYRARAEISSALLGSAHYNVPPPATPQRPTSHYVVEAGGKWFPVKEFRQTANGVVADLVGRDDPIRVQDVTGISATSVWDGA